MGRIITGFLLIFIAVSLAGCVNVNATVPDGIVSSAPRVDSSRVPHPKTLEESQAELNRAYAYIQRLERKVQKLEEDKSELKTEKAAVEKRLKRYEDD